MRRATPYWRHNVRVVAILLTLWVVLSLGFGVILVEPLNEIRVAGFKLGFWFAQQGAIVGFVVLVFVYAIWMDRIEARMRRDAHGGADQP